VFVAAAAGTPDAGIAKLLSPVIFIPLTFIAGVYGMNFEAMPELRHPLGYPIVLTCMGSIALTMVVFFRIRNWF
jgi:magnesium transporter